MAHGLPLCLNLGRRNKLIVGLRVGIVVRTNDQHNHEKHKYRDISRICAESKHSQAFGNLWEFHGEFQFHTNLKPSHGTKEPSSDSRGGSIQIHKTTVREQGQAIQMVTRTPEF